MGYGEQVLRYGLTEPVDAWVVTGFELVPRTWPLRATPPVDVCSELHCPLPSVCTYGTSKTQNITSVPEYDLFTHMYDFFIAQT